MKRAVLRALSGLLAITLAGSPLFAQRTDALHVGVAGVYFPDDERGVFGPWIAAELARELPGLRLHAMGSLVTGTGDAGGAIAGSAEGSLRRHGALGDRAAWEVGGDGSVLLGSSMRPSRSLLATGRVLHSIGESGGAWLRGAGHVAWREAGALGGGGVEAGAWRRHATGAFTATLVQQWAEAQLFASAERDRVLDIVPVRYTEASLAATAQRAWGSVELMAGARRDPDAPRVIEPIWRLSATGWQSASYAISASVSRTPPDFVRGADASYAFSVGLRFGGRPRGRERPLGARATLVVLGAATDSLRELRVRAASAHVVELMADFTDWEPVTMTPAEGEFVVRIPLTTGPHRVLVRIDGGAWLPPANVPSVDDDLGGRVGLLVVP